MRYVLFWLFTGDGHINKIIHYLELYSYDSMNKAHVCGVLHISFLKITCC